jgi:Family of unknown function (DUF5771)
MSSKTPKTITRAGYWREAYTRQDGTRVARAYVPPARIPGRGMAALTGRSLIDLEDYRHLSAFGYSFKKNARDREAPLRRATNAHGTTWAIRRLNALRTMFKNSEPTYHDRASHDINFVRQLHAEGKK